MARILTLTNWYPPHHFGGYEVLCADVMTGLHERGHQVQVLCSDETVPGAPSGESSPFPVHRRLTMYWRDGIPWTPGVRERLAIERSNQRSLEEILDEFDPDVVSVWHMGALSLSLLTTTQRRRRPLLYAICDEWLMYGIALDPWSRIWYPNPLRRVAGRLARPLLRTPTVVGDLGAGGCFCFLSRFTRESSRAGSPWNYPVDPVVYPGIDRAMYPPPDAAPPRLWDWKLLYTGRLDPRKGTDTLLRAMTTLPPEATVSFLGRGDPAERSRLERLAADLGVADRVHIESIAREALADAYRSHDCLIFPSEWPEPFGLVPIEAMACGTPVVGTGVGGSAEFLADGTNCLLFPPGDEVASGRRRYPAGHRARAARHSAPRGLGDGRPVRPGLDRRGLRHLPPRHRRARPGHPGAAAPPLQGPDERRPAYGGHRRSRPPRRHHVPGPRPICSQPSVRGGRPVPAAVRQRRVRRRRVPRHD